jgi:hypothetical protein
VTIEEWRPGFHKSLSNIADADAHLHRDEVRTLAVTALETIRQENIEAWVKFSTLVHYSLPT